MSIVISCIFLPISVTYCSLSISQGVSAIIGSVANDMGILTTPQLHWMVRCKNRGMKASESDYFAQLVESFRQVLK